MSDYEPNVLKKIQEAERQVSTREEVQANFTLVLQPDSHFEDLISPAPLSIALLGQLILLSLETDFSLEVKNATKPPELLNYPGSLRASLLQVSHAGWDAFNLANKNMDQIRLLTADVPTHVNKAVKIILGGTQDEMEIVLPKAMKNIGRIANDCTQKAKAVEGQFHSAMCLINELLELCTAKRGEHEQEIRENKAAKFAAEEAKKQMTIEQKEAKSEVKEMTDQLKQAREDYKEALEKIPSGWDLVGMSIVDKAANAIIDTAQMYTNPMRRVNAMTQTAIEATKSIKDTFVDGNQPQSVPNSQNAQVQDEKLKQIRHISSILMKLKNIVEIIPIYFRTQKETKPGQGETNVEIIKAKTQRLQREMKTNTTALLSQEVSESIGKSLQLIESIAEMERNLIKDSDEGATLAQEAHDLQLKVTSLCLQVDVQRGSLPTQATPMMAQADSDATANNSNDVVKSAVEISRMKFKQTSLVMNESMKQYGAANKRRQEANKDMTKLVHEIALYDMKEIDFKKIRETLIHGIAVLSKLREQWHSLVQYFQKMASIIEITLEGSLKGFLEDAKTAQDLRRKSALSKAMRDCIYVSASKANQMAFVVQAMSAAFVEVSEKHIMPPLAHIDTYMALDADKDKGKIRAIQKKIEEGAKEASEAVSEIIRERHDEILAEGYERIKKYEEIMNEALPPPTSEEIPKLKDMEEKATKPLQDRAGW